MKWKKTTGGNKAWVYTYFHDCPGGGADERERVGERDEWKFGQGVQGRGAVLMRHVGQGEQFTGLC
jgi:hypothetical protein